MPDSLIVTPPGRAGRVLRLVLASVLVGVAAGLGGLVLALLLRLTQHLAYGYSLDMLMGPQSFLDGVSGAPAWRRVVALALCGGVAGVGWWALRRHARPLVGISRAIEPGGPAMPPAATVIHTLLQIVTVGLGSPLGREVAPREIGAMFGGLLSRRFGLTAEDQRVLIACGAGAGLAAVYNVPLAGALFVLEVLLRTTAAPRAAQAMAICWIASWIAQLGLGDVHAYEIPPYSASPAMLAWSLLAGPVLGWAAYRYARLADWARRTAPHGARAIPACMAVFLAIGLLAVWFPQLPGNGKGVVQLGLDGAVPLKLAAVLLVLKVVATLACLRAGAAGGLMTPGLTIGALISTLLAAGAGALGLQVAPGACAIVGATAFLAASANMPVTAVVLLLEFTQVGQDFLVPMMAATAVAVAVSQGLAARERR